MYSKIGVQSRCAFDYALRVSGILMVHFFFTLSGLQNTRFPERHNNFKHDIILQGTIK